ncbi:AraC family transcriptional regulator [Neolewinella aurantiaca]|uniref:AraC family transcriptional regulator n=1 Tax=Neolewinella aurantiaca TaxID=2602767 RepID=A0A5C7FE94_9BACT|nr:helix-turn-helix domain-containing protein [Neolewinella aurantiaca]TXF87809.1 AraC family transcriptional regulator [Neolewinella aurantiaca]
MGKEELQNKVKIVEEFTSNDQLLSDNSMGIYFMPHPDATLSIHFKPLNEIFSEKVLTHQGGKLLNFERDLIDEDDIEYALDVLSIFNKYPLFVLSEPDKVRKIRQLLALVEEEYHNASGSYIMLKTLLKVLLLQMIRYQNDDFLVQDLNQKRVFQFLELMEINFLQETAPLFYANSIGISTKRLNQILKEKLNMTAKQIIQQRQITEAKRQLIRSEISTKELAFELGFDSISSFSRFFKNNTGLSPTAFKQEN